MHTWIWHTNPPRLDLKDLSQWWPKNLYYTLFGNNGYTNQTTRPTTTQQTYNSSGQSRWTSQTSTRGPLIRERARLHNEDHTSANKQATNTKTIPLEKTPRHFRRIERKISPKSFPTHHILYSCHLARGVSSRKANTANKLIITTIATFIFINNSHPQTQNTRTSTTQIVAWPSQQTPSTSSAKLAKQDIDGIFSTRRNSFDWHTGRGWAWWYQSKTWHKNRERGMTAFQPGH